MGGDVVLLDEVLYMEVRVFREFIRRFGLKAAEAYRLFEENDIWGYIESCYDVLHMSGDECVLEDIQKILNRKGAIA